MSDDFINFCKPCIREEEINEVVECLKSGWLTTGGRVRSFEKEFASYIGIKHAIALNSCTAALHLALEATGIKEGDLVLVPSMTFAATAEVVRYFNATPILTDCNEDDFCINIRHASEILQKIESGQHVKGVPEKHNGVRALIPVHFAGQIADVTACRDLCQRYNLYLIEDCAHCCPAFYKNKEDKWEMVSKSADIGCFSFYANKTITTGEGGMAVTDNPEWAEKIRIMSLHGISKDAWKRFDKKGSWKYDIIAPGFKYNMTDIAAALGIHQLKKADEFMARRKHLVKMYIEMLKDVSDITLPIEHPDRKHAWHLFIVRINSTAKICRDEVIEILKNKGIGTSVHYIPLHMHTYYKEKYNYSDADFPVASTLAKEILSLPLYPDLQESQVCYICETIKNILG